MARSGEIPTCILAERAYPECAAREVKAVFSSCFSWFFLRRGASWYETHIEAGYCRRRGAIGFSARQRLDQRAGKGAHQRSRDEGDPGCDDGVGLAQLVIGQRQI